MSDGVGDLVRAHLRLDLRRDDELIARVAALLGLEWAPPEVREEPDVADSRAAVDVVLDDDDFGDLFDGPTAPAASSERAPEVRRDALPDALPARTRLMPKTTPRSEGPAWWDGPATLPVPSSSIVALDHAPLLDPSRSRAVLATSMASPVAIGEVDIPRVVDAIVRGRGVVHVPRLSVRSLARGVQLLIDRGPGMLPFRRDVDDLVEQARAVVGGDRLELLWFDGCPASGVGAFGADADEPWTPPSSETPVVCVSDIGLGRALGRRAPPSSAEWTTFARHVVRSIGRRPVVWIPYGPSRWPGDLRRDLALVLWDRGATSQRVADMTRGTR